nr:MAG TPA: hypothetical protein [Caudoviricetes sp.]
MITLPFSGLQLIYDSIINFNGASVPYTETDITLNEADIYRT